MSSNAAFPNRFHLQNGRVRRIAQGLQLLAIAALVGFSLLLPQDSQAQLARAQVIKVDVPAAVPQVAPVHELRGLLPYTNDRHYFGLEATDAGEGFAVSLTVEPAHLLAEPGAVNFVVLTADGLQQFLAGADPLAVKVAAGKPLLFDQVRNRLTALVPGLPTGDGDTGGYTVIVYNNSGEAVTYTLQVRGGELRDDAGQTSAATGATMLHMPLQEEIAPVAPRAPVASRGGLVQRMTLLPRRDDVREDVTLEKTVQPVPVMPPVEPVRARRVSGRLSRSYDRHYLDLAADSSDGALTLTLRYVARNGSLPGEINFWVMTPNGVRHLVQGGSAQELNLAIGQPLPGQQGIYQAQLRMAPNAAYTLVIFNDSGSVVDYALDVEGGVLLDAYGQTNEAQAAAMEVLALAGE